MGSSGAKTGSLARRAPALTRRPDPGSETADSGSHQSRGSETTVVAPAPLGGFYAAGPVVPLGGAGPGGPVQFKLAVGRPGDAFEQEADAAASQVTSGGSVQAITPLTPAAVGRMDALQRKENGANHGAVQHQAVQPCENCDQEQEDQPVQAQAVQPCENCDQEQQDQPVQSQAVQPCENCDQEQQDQPVQAQTVQPCENCDQQQEEQPVQAQAVQPCENCDQEQEGQPALQTAPEGGAAGGSGGAAPAQGGNNGAHGGNGVAHAVSHPGPGSPLAPGVQSAIEPGLGADLSGVRVHHDNTSHSLARSLNARAFTHGRDIWLGPGESPHDLRLMAHESTHVVQQAAGEDSGVQTLQRQLQVDAERQFEAGTARPAGEEEAGGQPAQGQATPGQGEAAPAGQEGAPQEEPAEGGEAQSQAGGESTASGASTSLSSMMSGPAAPASEPLMSVEPGASGAEPSPMMTPAGPPMSGPAAGGAASEPRQSEPGGFTPAAGPTEAANMSTMEQGAPMSSEPMTSGPMSSEPMSSGPMSSEPMSSEPMSSGPMSSGPMSSEPMSSEPMSSEPMSSGPRPASSRGGGGPAGGSGGGGGAAPGAPTNPGAAPGGAAPTGAGGSTAPAPTATSTDSSGAGERVSGEGAGGGVNAQCYDEDAEEPEEEPESEPPEPDPTEAEENMDSESPEAEVIDDCPAEEAIASAADASAPAEGSLSDAAAATSEGGGPGPEGAAGDALNAAGGAGAARSGGGGGGGGAGGGEEEMPSSVETSISQLEGQRSEAVAAYDNSNALLGSAGADAPDLANSVRFAPQPGASAPEKLQEQQARDSARTFFQRAGSRMEDARELAQVEIPEKIGSKAGELKQNIARSIDSEKEAISNRITQARGQAYGAAAAARKRVNDAHDTAVNNMRSAHLAAVLEVTLAFMTANANINASETGGLSTINTLYSNARRDHEQAGKTVGGQAITRGEEYASAYHRCRINRKDSFWAGYLTDRRAEAQKNAARETAKGYQKNLEKEGRKQAREVVKGRQQDRCTLIAAARQARTSADDQFQGLLKSLQTQLDDGIRGAGATRDALLAQIDAALAGQLRQLEKQKKSQRQAANDTGYLQQVAIEQAAYSATASLQSAVSAALTSLEEALGQVSSSFATTPAPDNGTLDKVLSGAFGAVRGGLDKLDSQVNEGEGQAEQRLDSTASNALTALAGVTSTNDQLATSSSEQFSGSTGSIASGGESSLNQQGTSVSQQIKTAGSGGAAAITQVATNFATWTTTHTTNVGTGLTNSLERLTNSLNDTKNGMDDESKGIPKQAREAASHEAPAWKSVVKWVLIIAIIIVVAVVAGPAVIGAVGAAAASLGASAGVAAFVGAVVGGAIVGAATSATIQVLNNWETNRPLGQGVVRAAIIGAITGAIGGAAGFGVGKLVENSGRLLQFGANLATDAVLEVGTELVQGDLSWENFGQAMLMSLFTAGLGEVGSVRRMQARSMHAGASTVPGSRAHAYAESIRPAAPTEGGGAEPGPARPAEGEGGPARPAETAEPGPARPAEGAEPGPARPAEGESGPARPAESEPTPATRPGSEPEPTAPRAADETPPPPHADPDLEARARASETATAPRPDSGDAPRLEADPDAPANRRTNAELSETATPTKVGDSEHTVVAREFLGEIKLVGCSPSCGPITHKIDTMLETPNLHPDVRSKLETLNAEIRALETKIANGEVSSRQIVQETGRVAEALNKIGADHPELGARLDAPDSSADSTAAARQEHAGDWAVNPETGKFDKDGTMQGMKPDEVDTAARKPREGASEPDPVRRRRRHIAEREAAEGGEAMPMKEWAESGFRANVNRDASAPLETQALAATGATPNNAPGARETHTFKETVDSRGRPVPADSPRAEKTVTHDTRPDGTRPNARGGTDIIEHKHLTGDTDVLHDSGQFRAQRDMAENGNGAGAKGNGDHELIISSDRDLGADGRPRVHPSQPLGESGSRIYYYDGPSGRITHQWVKGSWRRINPGTRAP